MPSLRMTAGSLLGAGAVLLAMVCLPAAASAANITITYAGPDASGNPYDLTVTADDGNNLPILTMTAHVYNASMTDVADVPMTATAGSTSNLAAQTWAATNLIPEASLPAGTYTVTVDASDADESDSALPAPGFSFAYTSSNLTATMTPSYVTQGSQSVTFSGTFTGTAQGSTSTPVGIADAPVLLSVGGSTPTVVATTNATGDFSYPDTGVTPGSYVFSVAATATYPAASDTLTVPAEQATTSIANLAASPTSVTLNNQSVTFTGTVQVTPPQNSTTPVGIGSGVPVYLTVGSGTAAIVTSTDDANGDFTYTLPGIAAAATYTFSVASTSLYTSASAAVAVPTAAAPATMMVTASPAFVTFGSEAVTFNGTVTATPAGGAATGLGTGVPVFLSVDGGTPTQVATTDDASGDFSYQATGLTAGGDYTFSIGGTSLYTAATYEVPVDLDPGTTSVAATASPPDINLDSSTVTFSGTVSVTPFGSTTAAGVGSGVPVYLSIGGGTATQVTTTDDTNGDFTYTAKGITQAADYVFSVQAQGMYGTGSDSVPIGLDQVNSSLAVTPSPASVTEGSQSVTFTGTMTGTSPDGKNPVPVAIANATVDVSVGGGTPVQIGTTSSAGAFSYTASGLTQATDYVFSVASTSMYTAATADVTVAAVQAPTRFKGIRVTPPQLKYGQKATLVGDLQYLNGTTWTGLSDTAVELTEGKVAVSTVTTGSGGQFTATLPSTNGTFWTAMVDAGNLIQQVSTHAAMNIAVPVTVGRFTAKLQTDDDVDVAGCITTSAKIGYGPQPVTNIEYSASKHGPWHYLGQLPLDGSPRAPYCRGREDSYFNGAIRAKADNAWYRVDFPATPSLATYSFGQAYSSVIHTWMYATRIVSFSASPTTISATQESTLKARLEIRGSNGKWSPWAGQPVIFRYHLKHEDTTEWENDGGSVHTNPSGWAIADQQGGAGNFVIVMYAFYLGNAKHLDLASESQPVTITIHNGNSDVSLAETGPGNSSLVLPELYPEPLSLTPLLAG